MSKAAVSLISLEPIDGSGKSDASQGILAALVYDSLGEIFSQIQDGFEPIRLERVATSQEAVERVLGSDTSLLVSEVKTPEQAFQILLTLKLLKSQVSSGQVRVIVHCTVQSKTLIDKFRQYGCTEVITAAEASREAVQSARILIELLLFRRAVRRLPGGKITSVGLAFMLVEWITQQGVSADQNPERRRLLQEAEKLSRDLATFAGAA